MKVISYLTSANDDNITIILVIITIIVIKFLFKLKKKRFYSRFLSLIKTINGWIYIWLSLSKKEENIEFLGIYLFLY